MRANDDPDYPDQVGIFDVIWDAVEGRAIRIFWGDVTAGPPGVFTRLIEMFPNIETINFLPVSSPTLTPVLSLSPEGLLREQLPAYLYKETLYYTANSTFFKLAYPGLRAIKVRAIGGGGAGGGAATTAATTIAVGGGGGGGEYIEAWILEADLDGAGEAITIGAGGAGVAGAGGNAGTDTVLDTIPGEVRASGGNGGGGGVAAVPVTAFGNMGAGGGTFGAGGQLSIPGGDGTNGFGTSTTRVHPGSGGGTSLAGRRSSVVTAAGAAGTSGRGPGGGGSGGGNAISQGTARLGGAGAGGFLTIEIYT